MSSVTRTQLLTRQCEAQLDVSQTRQASPHCHVSWRRITGAREIATELGGTAGSFQWCVTHSDALSDASLRLLSSAVRNCQCDRKRYYSPPCRFLEVYPP